MSAETTGNQAAWRSLLKGTSSANPRPVLIATVLLFVFSAVFVPATLSPTALQSVIPLAAVLAVASIGQTLIIQQRGIDLSAPGLISMTAIIVTIFSDRFHLPLPVVLVLVLASSLLAGFVNGTLVVVLGITPMIATLASNFLFLGIARVVSGGAPVASAPAGLTSTLGARVLGVPLLAWVALIVVAIAAFIMSRTSAARRFVAAGNSPAAANASGVNIRWQAFASYVVGALCVSLAGVLLISYVKTSSMSLGDPYLLMVIAAAIVGGTGLNGGQGTIVGSAIAAVFLTQLTQLVTSLGAPSSVQLLIQSIAIAVAAVLRSIPWSRLRGLLPAQRRLAPAP